MDNGPYVGGDFHVVLGNDYNAQVFLMLGHLDPRTYKWVWYGRRESVAPGKAVTVTIPVGETCVGNRAAPWKIGNVRFGKDEGAYLDPI